MGTVLVGQQGGGGVANSKTNRIGIWGRLKSNLLKFGPSRRIQEPVAEAEPLKVIIESDLSGVIYQDIGRNYKNGKFYSTWPYKGITIAATLTTISLLFTTIMWLTNIYGNTILKLVSIRNDIDTVFELWRVPPTRPTLSVYIFNYTNHKKVLEGKEKPHVTEVGPYVFREKMERINVKFNSNGTVSFQEKRNIIADKDKSVGPMNATVIVPNVPFITILKTVRSLFYFDQKLFSTFVDSYNADPFQNLTVNDFIWGYEDEFFKMLKKMVRFLTQQEAKGFGFLDKRRGIHHDIVTMYTGENDLDTIGQITRWNGKQNIGCWGNNTECDKLTGSDGTMFPVRATKEGRTLHVYSHSMCRTLPLHFKQTTESADGFPVQEYDVAHNIFDFTNKTKENKCFLYKGEYPPSGVFNTGPCQNDKPIYASYPHFWQGEVELQQSIDGLKPDTSKHRSYFQIHKKLGICLKAKTRFQLNIKLHKALFMHQTEKLKNDAIILPIGWLEYDSGELPEHFVNIINHLTYTVSYVEETLKWIFLTSTVCSIIYLFIQIKNFVRQS